MDPLMEKVAFAALGALAAVIFGYLFRVFMTRSRAWRRNRRQLIEQPFRKEQTRVSLTFIDPKASTCVYDVLNYFVFQEDNVTSYKEILIAEGKIEGEDVEPGEITDKRFDFGHFNYLITLGKSFNRGDTLAVRFSARLIDSFPADRELWTHEVLTRTNQVVIRVHFHPERPPTKCLLYKRKGPRYTEMHGAMRVVDELGRRCGEAIISEPRIGDVYKVEWAW